MILIDSDLSTTSQEASFTKAQETLHYVSKDLVGRCMQLVVPFMACVYNHARAMQELEWQGMGHLRGMCSSLMSSGAAGKHKQNIRRDMLRKLSAKNPEIKVP